MDKIDNYYEQIKLNETYLCDSEIRDNNKMTIKTSFLLREELWVNYNVLSTNEKIELTDKIKIAEKLEGMGL